jgi:hypothetical protein
MDSTPSTPSSKFKETRSAVVYLVKYSADMAAVSADMAALTITRNKYSTRFIAIITKSLSVHTG